MKILPTTTLEEIFKYLVPRTTLNKINHFKKAQKAKLKFILDTFISKNNFAIKFLVRTWPYLIVFAIFVVYASYTFLRPGYIIYTDVTEPLKVDNLYERYVYTYSDDIGESLAESARIPLFYTIFGAYKASFMGDQFYIKIKILILFLFNFVAFSWSIKETLKVLYKSEVAQRLKFLEHIQTDLHNNKHNLEQRAYFVIPILLSTIYYCTNFWFSNRIMHFHLFFSSVTIPVTFAVLMKYFFEPEIKPKYIIALTIFLGVFTATPHTVLFEALLFGAFLFSYISFTKEKPINKAKRLGIFLLFPITYILINFYWILPFVVSNSTPDAVPSKTIIELLSKNASAVYSIRLMGYWLTDLHEYFIHASAFVSRIENILTFVPLIIFGTALILFRKHKIAEILLIIFLIGLFFATSSVVSNNLYFYMMFNSPLSSIGWIFREYDKFGIIVAFAYAVGIALVLFNTYFHKKRRILITLIVVLTLIQQLYFLDHTINKYYVPQDVPDVFTNVNDLLRNDLDEFNVVWYPGVPNPVWGQTGEVRYKFGNLISAKPSFTTRSDSINYINYILNNKHIKNTDLAKSLDLVGIKYLIIRTDDETFESNDLVDVIDTKPGMEKVFSNQFLTVYKNKEFTGIAKTYDSKLTTNLGLAITSKLDDINFDTSKTYIDFTDMPSNFSNIENFYYLEGETAYFDVLMNKYQNKFLFPWDYLTETENGNADKWRKTSLENITHAESDFFFGNLGLYINQMDYGKGVSTARDGFQRKENSETQAKPINITFDQHKNLLLVNGQIFYSTLEDDFKYYWNIIRSDKFDTTKTKAIEVKMNTKIDEKLIPHFKIYSYDENGDLLDARFIYADRNGTVDTIVKIPNEAVSADFSIWTLSTTGQPYSYSAENFSIEDITDSVKPITMQIEDKRQQDCNQNCVIMARVLKSDQSGLLEIQANDSVFQVDTKIQLPERYEWVKVGDLQTVKEPITYIFRNLQGFNSINAVVLISQEEYQSMQARKDDFMQIPQVSPQEKVELLNEIQPQTEAQAKAVLGIYDIRKLLAANTLSATETTQENTGITGPEPTPRQIFSNYDNSTTNTGRKTKIKKLNPTLYIVQLGEKTSENYILSFAKPFDKNWVLQGQSKEAHRINSIINGWELTGEQTQYTIEFRPQRYLYTGALVSGMTLGTLLIFMGMHKLNKKD